MLTKREQYAVGCEHAAGKANSSPTEEIAAIWAQISDSYRFLMEREERLVAEERQRDLRLEEFKAALVPARRLTVRGAR